jgi:SSS family solute:Na+ symporter
VIAFHVFEGNLDTPDEAYPRLVSLLLPAWLMGFFAAVMVGAILSTFNSALNSCATLFSTDVYKGWLKPGATELQMVHFGKWVGVVLALAAMTVAPLVANAPDGLYILLQTLNGIFNVPIFTVVFVGLITKRVPPLAAKLVLVVGPLMYLLITFVIKPDIHFLHIMGILGVFNLALMLIVGLVAPMKEAYVQEYTGDVDITPWKYRIPVSIFIVICTISCYVFFARG